jgi:hypothetical protein
MFVPRVRRDLARTNDIPRNHYFFFHRACL